MKTRRLAFLVSCLILLFGVIFAQIVPAVNALAADEKLDLSTKFPSFSGKSNDTFTFSIEAQYSGGTEPRVFDLAVNGPGQFDYNITSMSGGGSTDITAVKLDPTSTYPETISVKANPNPLNPPDPGKYKITFTASSGDLKQSIDLSIEITARYDISLITPDGLLSASVTADQSNAVKLIILNTGSSTLENISLSQYIKGGPSGWEVKFDPEKIASLAPGDMADVSMNVKPSSKTISGDYEIVVTAKTDAGTASSDLTIRVTVLTQQIWGWIGVAIIVVVVAGLIAMFILLGRR